MILAAVTLTKLVSAAGQAKLLDRFLAGDGTFLDSAQIEASRQEFEELTQRATPCGFRDSGHRLDCLVDATFSTEPVTIVPDPGDPESSTVTSALASHRGNCAALAALVLALADRVKIPIEAVVFPRHVVVRSPGADRAFELLQRGTATTMSQLRHQLRADEDIVRVWDFPAYYLDNLAVRFAEAGDTPRAEAMFAAAIDTAPRLARVRFNFGTYLLEKERFPEATKQLKRAVHLDATNAPAWANLGVAYSRRGNLDDARRCFERALRIDPRNTSARSNLSALGRPAPSH